VPENSAKFRFRLIASLSALTFALTGCSELPASAPITPVNYRACLVTEGSADDNAVNALADYSIKQAVVTYGIQRSVSQSTPAKFAATVKKMVAQKCNLVVVSGSGFASQLSTVVAAMPAENFVYLSDSSASELLKADLQNLSIYEIDLYEAGLVSGYVAASISVSHVVTMACGTRVSETYLEGARAGAARFDQVGMTNTRVNPAAGLAVDYTDVLLTAGCVGDLAPIGQDPKVVAMIGYGPDLYLNQSLGDAKSRVATTVIPQIGSRLLEIIASDLEGDFIGGSLGSTVAHYGNGGLQLSPNHDFSLSGTVVNELQSVTTDYEAGLK
jgi:basic membrane protein A